MQSENGKDPLLANKIIGAGLAALLLIFGLPQLTAALFGGGHHGGDSEELHLAYCCVELETEATDATEEAPPDLGTLLANASVSAGSRRAAICQSCHTFEEGGANGTGPNLWNVVGRPVASVPGFNYTSALKEFGGTWTYERLDEFLHNSQEYVPGTAMVQRFPRDDQRADILAYLGSLSNNPVPYPEPAPAVTPEETEPAAADAAESADPESEALADEAVSDAAENGAEEAANEMPEEAEASDEATENAVEEVAGDEAQPEE